jgi:hypothetical protein
MKGGENTLTIEVMALITVVSVVFGVYQILTTKKRNDRKDIQCAAEENASINVKLDNIIAAVAEFKSEIKLDLSGMKIDVKDVIERQIITEQSYKSLHKRVDIIDQWRLRFENREAEQK